MDVVPIIQSECAALAGGFRHRLVWEAPPTNPWEFPLIEDDEARPVITGATTNARAVIGESIQVLGDGKLEVVFLSDEIVSFTENLILGVLQAWITDANFIPNVTGAAASMPYINLSSFTGLLIDPELVSSPEENSVLYSSPEANVELV